MTTMATNYWDWLDSPIGRVAVELNTAGELSAIHFPATKPEGIRDSQRCRPVVDQLNEYFAGNREQFTLPLALEGTAFQTRVWRALCRIPYGRTISYQELAKQVGNPKASRAVGSANGANPIPIVVPCHRVITSDHRLGGYAGGLDAKAKLLALEGASPELF
jgi:methylated-DNA-[protein]-cysteine S-methyltransferase